MKFIVYTPLGPQESGGRLVLIELAQCLQAIGHEVAVFLWDVPLPGMVKDLSISGLPVAGAKDIDQSSDIIIYPEIISGNPLNAARCVRWILCRPGLHSPDYTDTWGSDDLIMHYGLFGSEINSSYESSRYLFVITLDSRWRANSGQKRDKYLYIIRKANMFHSECRRLHPEGALHLDPLCDSTQDYIDFYRKGRLLFCYDPFTFHCQLSALSGCIPVIHPLGQLSRDQWCKQNPYYSLLPFSDGQRFIPGIAYGLTDVELARDTVHLLWPTLMRVKEEGMDSVSRFAHTASKKFLPSRHKISLA